MPNADNKVQYSAETSVNGGEVKRGAAGAQIDDIGAPMIVTFNQNGQFNLSDYGQPTESNIAPKLHIDWTD